MGQQCINFLKQNSLGTATFIALDKMERWLGETRKTSTWPENVSRLYDLIKVNDERVKTAFYYAIRNTLVATDLDQASRIAYGKQRHRVVTLKGELLEVAGTMSGGGKSVSRGRMGNSAQAIVTVTPQEVEQIEAHIEQLSQTHSQLRRQKTDYENQLQSRQKDLRTMQMNVQKYKLEIDSCRKQVESLAKQEELQCIKVAEVKSDPAKVKQMDAVIEVKMAAFKLASGKADEVEAEVTRINNQIQSITSGKMKTLKKKLNDLEAKIKQVIKDRN